MTKNMLRDAVAIKAELRNAESSSDELLMSTAELMKRMLTARQNPAVAPHAGQAAILRLIAAQQKIAGAASDLYRVHNEMSRAGVAYGVMDEPGTTPHYADATADDIVSEAAELAFDLVT